MDRLTAIWYRLTAATRAYYTRGIPSWLRQGTLLVVVWLVGMTAVTLWAPWQGLDHNYFEHLEASQQVPLYPSARLVDVRIDDSGTPQAIGADRCTIASFLDRLVDLKQSPAAVVLDFAFHPVTVPPCTPRRTDSRTLPAAIARVEAAGVNVYSTVGDIPMDEAGVITGTPAPLDASITHVIPPGNIGQTQMRFPGRPMYQRCYPPAGFRGGEQWSTGRDLWSVPDLVAIPDVAQSNVASCDTSAEMVFVGQTVLPMASPTEYAISSARPFPAGAQFSGDYVVLGTLQYDQPAAHLPECSVAKPPIWCRESGPEILTWAISDRLWERQSSAGAARTVIGLSPLNGMLLLAVPAFSSVVALAFAAWFFVLKRLVLQRLRPLLPWTAAALALCVGLVAFFEVFQRIESGHGMQPQIALISAGMLFAAALCGVRGKQIEFEQRYKIANTAPPEAYDYDVFISYAREELSWVREHVCVPLENARLADGTKLKVFFDTSTIRVGTAWQDNISLAIDGSHFIVPVYSETYFKKPYCCFEIKRAHLKWIKAGAESRCVLPIMRGNIAGLQSSRDFQTVQDIQAISIDAVPDLVDRITAEIVERLSRKASPPWGPEASITPPENESRKGAQPTVHQQKMPDKSRVSE